MAADAGTIRFEHTSKRYTTPARGEVWALRGVDLACEAGGLTCVLGPSGCGKTTLLRLAAGLESPTAGRVVVDGRPVTAPPPGIALVSQEGALLPWRRVIDNVALGLEIRKVGRAERRARAREAIRRVHLPPSVDRSLPHELSGGMRQRVALARALCPGPRILLMDEPFAAVDEPTRHLLQDELVRLWQADRQTILFVTHNVEEAVTLADRLVVMTFSRTVAEVPVPLPRPRDRLDRAFVDTLLEVRRTFAEHADGKHDGYAERPAASTNAEGG